MRIRPRPAWAVYQRWMAAGVLLGVGGAITAVLLAPSGGQAAVGWTAGVALLLWCGLVAVAARAAGQARQRADELAVTQRELVEARGRASGLHADLSEAHAASAKLRAVLNATQAEGDRSRIALATTRTALAELEAEAVELRANAAEYERERAELAQLETEVLPDLVKRLRAGASVASALAAQPQDSTLLRLVADEIGQGERQRAAALAVCATAAGRVQALATSMHAELREMQHRHNEDVLGDLLSLDHATAQVGRMADGIAVLTGARSGRRWTKPIAVESILRGALGRIGAYQRVRLHSASTAALAGYAAEGVMHTLAELMDNATNFSAPPAEVHVYVEEGHTGLAITVEDGGLGLSDSWLRRAERAVSAEPLDLTALSSGTRLGFAVVGSLARKHGLAVSFRPSARGGTGVVLLIPAQLVSHPVTTPEPKPARPAGPAVARPVLEPRRPVAAAALPATTENGLPQRRRGQTLPAPQAVPAPQPVPPVQPVRSDAAAAAARFGAFRKALQPAQPDLPDARPKDDD